MNLFSTLSSLVIAIPTCFCACQPLPSNRQGGAAVTGQVDQGSFVSIAAIIPSKANHVVALLDANGIPSIVEGSMVHGVYVAPGDKEEAITLLRADSEKEDYYLNESLLLSR